MRHRKAHIYLVLFLSMLLVFAPVFSALGASANVQKVQDNELVITTLDEQGATSDIQVLSHLRAFGSGTAAIQDGENFKLSSVRNLYGKEKISQKDNKLGVNINMSKSTGYGDVYYMSDLDKSEISKVKMPVSVKVSYYLDGQKMAPSKIAGKSGHLKIVTELENLTGAKKSLEYKNSKGEMVKTEATIYTPYVVSLSGWEFDNKLFSHVVAPGVSGKSGEGVVVDVQGKSTVSWSVPLIPPAYPAKQYTTLEADGKDIALPSFKIAVVPIVPTTSAEDTLGTVQDSLGQLYGAFDQIQGGVGAPDKDATLLFGLTSLKGGLGQLSGGIASLGDKIKQLKMGVSNTAFNAATFDAAKGTDGRGNKPGVREAVKMGKAALDTKVIPAMEGQKQVLTVMETTMGKAGSDPVQPSLSTSFYNDATYLKGLVKGTPAEAVIDQALMPKIMAFGVNINVLKSGGTLITPTGTMPFPASVNTVEQGIKSLSGAMEQTDAGLGLISAGIGPIDANGQPVKVMVNGNPGTILYALSYFKSSIDGKVMPGLDQLIAGSSKIGAGSGLAKDGISAGLDKMATAPAIISALKDNAAQADSFLGKPEGAEATVAYVYQTPAVSRQGSVMNYGLGAIVIALIVLFAVGRPPKMVNSVQDASQNM